MSLAVRVYLHSFSCCCMPNLRNNAKYSENSNLHSSSRSSNVIDLGTNRKHICNFLLVINSNFGRKWWKRGKTVALVINLNYLWITKLRTYDCLFTAETSVFISSTEGTCCPAEVGVVEHDEWQPTVCDENRLIRVRLNTKQKSHW